MRTSLSWGIIGTGRVAAAFARGLCGSGRFRIVDVTTTSIQIARAFAHEWRIHSFTSSIPRLLSNRDVEAVFVATDHPIRQDHVITSIQAGKHVLCEAPLAGSASDAQRVIDAARYAGVFLMEVYAYRCHPLAEDLARRLASGAIG